MLTKSAGKTRDARQPCSGDPPSPDILPQHRIQFGESSGRSTFRQGGPSAKDPNAKGLRGGAPFDDPAQYDHAQPGRARYESASVNAASQADWVLSAALGAPTGALGGVGDAAAMTAALDAAMATLGDDGAGAGEEAWEQVSSGPRERAPGERRVRPATGMVARDETYAHDKKKLLESCAAAAATDPSLQHALAAAKVMMGAGVAPSAQAYAAMLQSCANAVVAQAAAASPDSSRLGTAASVRALHGCTALVGPSKHLGTALDIIEQMQAVAQQDAEYADEVAVAVGDELERLIFAWLHLAGPNGAAGSAVVRLRALLAAASAEKQWTDDERAAIAVAGNGVIEGLVECASGQGLMLQGLQLVSALRRSLPPLDGSPNAPSLWQRADLLTSHVISHMAAAGESLERAVDVVEMLAAHGLLPHPDVCNGLMVECGRLAAGGGALAPALSLLQEAVSAGSDMASAGGGELVLAAAALAHPRGGALGTAQRLLDVLRRTPLRLDPSALAVVLQGAARLACGQGALKVASELCHVMALAAQPSPSSTSPATGARWHVLTRQCETVLSVSAAVLHGHEGALRQALQMVRAEAVGSEARDPGQHGADSPLSAAFDAVLLAALTTTRAQGAVETGYELLVLARRQNLPLRSAVCDEVLESLATAVACQRLPCAGLSTALLQQTGEDLGASGGDDGMVGVGAFVAGELLSDALAGRVGGAGCVSGVVQRVAQVWMEEAAACRGAVSEGEGGLVRMTATYLDLVLPRAKANSSPGSTEGASGVAVAVLMRGVCEVGKGADLSLHTTARLLKMASTGASAVASPALSGQFHTLLDACSSAAVVPAVSMGLELARVLDAHDLRMAALDRSLLTNLLSTAQTACRHAGRAVRCGLELLQSMPHAQISPSRAACNRLIQAAAQSQNRTLTGAFQVLALMPDAASAAAADMLNAERAGGGGFRGVSAGQSAMPPPPPPPPAAEGFRRPLTPHDSDRKQSDKVSQSGRQFQVSDEICC